MKGFIFITLGLTAVVTLAGSPGYLPRVGPVPLRMDRGMGVPPPVALPILLAADETAEATNSHMDHAVEIPVSVPTNSITAQTPAPAPVLPPATGGSPTNLASDPLIGPWLETSGVVTPQMFLRFFSPPQGGVSHETILAAPVGFNPARPPVPQSSTVIFTQPKQ